MIDCQQRNLRRRQVEMSDCLSPFCRTSEETAGHLFFQCSKIIHIWWESLSWVDTVVALPENPRLHFLQHTLGRAAGIGVTRWRCWWLALTWTIWKQRNNLLFSNGTLNANKLLDDALFLLWTWLRNLEPHFVIHYNQWSSNLRECFA